MSVSGVASGSTSSSATSAANALTSATTTLGENSFLQLLVDQMKYQNPLQPTDNTQFISELAQFSSLEQTSNVAADESLANAYSLLGNSVTIKQSDGSDVTGAVSAVSNSSGTITVTVNGSQYDVSSIVSVTK